MPNNRAILRYASACIHGAEGFRSVAYLDRLAKPAVWTIGYGTTRIDRRPVRQGDTCTRQQADAWAENDMWATLAYVQVNVMVAIDDWQAAALTALTYNIGMGHFHESSVLAALNEAHYYVAADCILEYDHAGGVQLPGLTLRRQRERAMFLCQMPPPRTLQLPQLSEAALESLDPPLSEADVLNQRELDKLRGGG